LFNRTQSASAEEPFSSLTGRAAIVTTSLPETPTDTSSDIPDTVAAIDTPCLLSLTTLAAAAIKNLELVFVPATIKTLNVTALLDSGATDVYVIAEIAQPLCLENLLIRL